MGNIGSGMKIEQVKDPEKGREVQIKLEKGNRTRKPQESSYHMLNQEWIFKVRITLSPKSSGKLISYKKV